MLCKLLTVLSILVLFQFPGHARASGGSLSQDDFLELFDGLVFNSGKDIDKDVEPSKYVKKWPGKFSYKLFSDGIYEDDLKFYKEYLSNMEGMIPNYYKFGDIKKIKDDNKYVEYGKFNVFLVPTEERLKEIYSELATYADARENSTPKTACSCFSMSGVDGIVYAEVVVPMYRPHDSKENDVYGKFCFISAFNQCAGLVGYNYDFLERFGRRRDLTAFQAMAIASQAFYILYNSSVTVRSKLEDARDVIVKNMIEYLYGYRNYVNRIKRKNRN